MPFFHKNINMLVFTFCIVQELWLNISNLPKHRFRKEKDELLQFCGKVTIYCEESDHIH